MKKSQTAITSIAAEKDFHRPVSRMFAYRPSLDIGYNLDMQFHAVQHDVTLHAHKENRRIIEDRIDRLGSIAGDFVVLSEMSDTGWSMDLQAVTGIGTVDWACSLSRRSGIWLQVGWADRNGRKGRNLATICSPEGESVATYAKVFTCNPLNEHTYYDTGDSLVVVDLGCEGVVACPSICYDVRFPELWRPAAIAGANVFTVSSSWPMIRIEHWRSLLIARAIENQAFVVATNRVGRDLATEWGGASMIVSPMGEVLAEAGVDMSKTISVELDIDTATSWRNEFPVMNDIRDDLIGKIDVRRVTA